MAGRISVVLCEDEREALLDYALRKYRDPREQAAKFIVEGLRAAGALPQEVKTLNVAGDGPATT
jgi:hypothetical protein